LYLVGHHLQLSSKSQSYLLSWLWKEMNFLPINKMHLTGLKLSNLWRCTNRTHRFSTPQNPYW